MKLTKKLAKCFKMLVVTSMVVNFIATNVTTASAATKTAGEDLVLYPNPRNISFEEGTLTLSNGVIHSDDPSLKAVQKMKDDVAALAGVNLINGDTSALITLTKDESLDEQGYSLTIDGSGIRVSYKDDAGAYYAATTLYQVLYQAKNELPYLTITNDHPDFAYRAFEMDISRNRLPNVDTAKRVIDLMANLKYNQMFFYFEGFSYAYGHYPQVWSGGDPLTPQQAKELSDYASARGIDLIPMQNSFGHSSNWIAHNDFKELGDSDYASTFNIFDPKTQAFLNNIYDDLFTDGFTTDSLHICGDETSLDLTGGRAAASWKALHPGEEPSQQSLYLDSMEIIGNIAKSKGKKVYYWADMIIHYDLYDQIKKAMPENAVAMDWGYLHDYDFDKSTSKLKAAGVPFYVAPGDASWSTITGNTYVMNKNAENAAVAGKKNGAVGYLMTNWGDAGHYQNIITTYPAIVYAGGLSWCSDTNTKDVENNPYNAYEQYMNIFLYKDSTNTIAQAFSELADFSNNYLPYGWNGNWIANCMVEDWKTNDRNLWDFMDFQKDGKDNVINEEVRDLAIAQCAEVSKAVEDFLVKLENANIQADDAEILKKEFKNTAEMTKIAADYSAMRLRLFTGGSITKPLTTPNDEKDTAIASAQEFQNMLADFKTIWNARDVYGEYPSTLGWISKPSMMYRDIAGTRNIYQPQADGNLFLKTPETIGNNLQIDDFVVAGWTWTNYGSGMPAIANTYMGADNTGSLKNGLKDGVFSMIDSMPGATGMVFAYDSKAAIQGGYYSNNPDWGALLPRCGWPAIIPADGEYVVTARLQFKSGREVKWNDSLVLSGSANKISDNNITDIPQETISAILSQPDANGWVDMEVHFRATNVAGISLGILPQNAIQDDTLYMTDLIMKQVKADILITSDAPAYQTLHLNQTFTVPNATSNGSEPIVVTLQKPDGTSDNVSMGDKILASKTGVYRLTYNASDAKAPLILAFEVMNTDGNLFTINDENATGFIQSSHYFSLMNPYYELNNGFNNDYKLIASGSGASDPNQYAALLMNVDGGNGQVIQLKTENLSEYRMPSVHFSATVEPGKTYRMSIRMKFMKGNDNPTSDLGPFQTAITYFNETISDQAKEVSQDGQFTGNEYIDQLLDPTQKQLAQSGEWFTLTREFTVPETVKINGQDMAPTAMDTFFMTSALDGAENQHTMLFDDAVLVEVKDDVEITKVYDSANFTVAVGTAKDDLILPESVTVKLSDDTVRKVTVNWACDQYDANIAGTYTFIGTLVLPQGVLNSNQLAAQLQVTLSDKRIEENLFTIHDENAKGFINSTHYHSLMNPYFEGHYAFNDEFRLVASGSGVSDPAQFAELVGDVDGGHGQVVKLITDHLSEWRMPFINFSAKVEPGKTYRLHVRMKLDRADHQYPFDIAPFQTAINYFDETISDQLNDQSEPNQYIGNLLDESQAQLASNGEWFTLIREFTVPATININGMEVVPTALNTFFMTSATNDPLLQHAMWLDDVTLVEVVPHILTHVAPKNPSCTEAGNIEYWVCEDCGQFFSDAAGNQEITKESTIVEALGHQLTHIEREEATETSVGNIEYWYCQRCNRYFADAACTIEITLADTLIPVKPENPENPENPDDTDPTETEMVDEIVSADNNVTIIGKFHEDVELIVESLSEERKAEMISNITNQKAFEKYTFERIFDIYMMRKGVAYHPNGNVTIRIKLDQELATKRYLGIVYISDENEATIVPSKVENGYITFETNHNSYYAIISSDSPITNTASNPSSVNNGSVWILLGAAFLFCTKKKEKEIRKLYRI